jgi:hypothetical protein
MLKKKQAGVALPKGKATDQPRNVVNLMDALKRSLARDRGGRPQEKKSKKRIAGQGEMLLPIRGSKAETKKPLGVRAGSRQRKAG